MIELALITGISPKEWAEEGGRSIATALELLDEQHKRTRGRGDGVQYSG